MLNLRRFKGSINTIGEKVNERKTVIEKSIHRRNNFYPSMAYINNIKYGGFTIGARVILKERHVSESARIETIHKGETGTVKRLARNGSIGVEMDNHRYGTSTLHMTIPNHTGRYFKQHELEVI